MKFTDRLRQIELFIEQSSYKACRLQVVQTLYEHYHIQSALFGRLERPQCDLEMHFDRISSRLIQTKLQTKLQTKRAQSASPLTEQSNICTWNQLIKDVKIAFLIPLANHPGLQRWRNGAGTGVWEVREKRNWEIRIRALRGALKLKRKSRELENLKNEIKTLFCINFFAKTAFIHLY